MAKGLAHLPTSRLVQGSNLNLAAWGNSLLCNSDGLKLVSSVWVFLNLLNEAHVFCCRLILLHPPLLNSCLRPLLKETNQYATDILYTSQ
jgi:hypothetical protein